jgi:hypothetical protein
MNDKEIRLEIVKAVFPIYKDLNSFKRVADELFKWVCEESKTQEVSTPVKKIVAKQK